MEVLLLEDVGKLGRSGDVVKVAAGFARNFLLPRRWAVPATPDVIAAAQGVIRRRQAERRKVEDQAQVLKERLEALEISLSLKLGRQDQSYGALTNADIARALEKQGIVLDRRKILLEQPIRALGNYRVGVKLSGGVEAILKVSVLRA